MVSRSSYFRKKESLFSNVIVSAVFSIIFFGIIGVLVFQNIKIYQKRAELDEASKSLQAQIAELERKKQELEMGIRESQSAEFQEKILREQGLYKKPGEEVVTILPPPEEQPQKSEKKKIWWQPWTWLSLFNIRY